MAGPLPGRGWRAFRSHDQFCCFGAGWRRTLADGSEHVSYAGI